MKFRYYTLFFGAVALALLLWPLLWPWEGGLRAETSVSSLVDKERAKFDDNNYVQVAVKTPAPLPVSGTVAVTGIANPLPVSGTVAVTGIANPLPVSGTVTVTGIANPLPVSAAAAPKVPTCDFDTAPTCMTVTDAEDEIALPSSANSLYLVTVREIDGAANAAAVDCISGAAPEAVYGTTGFSLSAPFVGYLEIAEAKFSCDAPATKTLYLCVVSCIR